MLNLPVLILSILAVTMTHEAIPVHDFSKDDASSIPFKYEPIKLRKQPVSMSLHRHNYCEIFAFTNGKGSHLLDTELHDIKKNMLHFVSPGQVHQIKREPGSEGHVIFFSRDFLLSSTSNKQLLFELPFFNNFSVDPTLQLSDDQMQKVLQLIQNIKTESELGDAQSTDLIRSYLHTLLLLCLRYYTESKPQQAPDRSAKMVRELQALLDQHFREEHQVQYYAKQLHTTPKTLNEACKQVMNRTASDLIYDRLILEAQRLLLHSDLSTKEIAYFLSYQDPAHFSKFFKKRTGKSPSELREG